MADSTMIIFRRRLARPLRKKICKFFRIEGLHPGENAPCLGIVQEDDLRDAPQWVYEMAVLAIPVVMMASTLHIEAKRMSPPAPKTILVERTTWYGQAYHGRTTASGEIFDATAMTCAHPKLPFGTWLRVGWLGRFVIVRVTDRMPGSSCLDLTAAAFRVLAPHRVGVLHGATIEVLP